MLFVFIVNIQAKFFEVHTYISVPEVKLTDYAGKYKIEILFYCICLYIKIPGYICTFTMYVRSL
jgi:hypothetical protein